MSNTDVSWRWDFVVFRLCNQNPTLSQRQPDFHFQPKCNVCTTSCPTSTWRYIDVWCLLGRNTLQILATQPNMESRCKYTQCDQIQKCAANNRKTIQKRAANTRNTTKYRNALQIIAKQYRNALQILATQPNTETCCKFSQQNRLVHYQCLLWKMIFCLF